MLNTEKSIRELKYIRKLQTLQLKDEPDYLVASTNVGLVLCELLTELGYDEIATIARYQV